MHTFILVSQILLAIVTVILIVGAVLSWFDKE